MTATKHWPSSTGPVFRDGPTRASGYKNVLLDLRTSTKLLEQKLEDVRILNTTFLKREQNLNFCFLSGVGSFSIKGR
jgi:hypothetical protein